MKDNTQSKISQKKPGVAILPSAKLVFKPKVARRDKDGQYIMIKETIHQENITLKMMSLTIKLPIHQAEIDRTTERNIKFTELNILTLLSVINNTSTKS